MSIHKTNSFGHVAGGTDTIVDALDAKGNLRLHGYCNELSRQLVQGSRPTARLQYNEPELDCYRCIAASKFTGQHKRGKCQLCHGTGKVPNRHYFDGSINSAVDILEMADKDTKAVRKEDRPFYLPIYEYRHTIGTETKSVLTTDSSLHFRRLGIVGVVFASQKEVFERYQVSDKARYVPKVKRDQLYKDMWIYLEE